MISVEQARVKAQQRLIAKTSEWALIETWSSEKPAYEIVLHPPTEREMLDDQSAAHDWARSWAAIEAGAARGERVEWSERTWRSIGRQRVPVRLVIDDPDAVAGFVGGAAATAFALLRQRIGDIRRRLGASSALDGAMRRHASDLLSFDEQRFAQVVDAAVWLVANSVDGLRPRQLPIRGVDTKWFGSNRAVVTSLVTAVTGRTDLGIVTADRLIRVRILDQSLAIGGLDDFAAPPDDLARLELRPRVVLMIENLETVLAMPPLPGAIAVHGSGYAVDSAARIPWVAAAPVLYWGDLDSNGLAILHQLRSWHPRVESVLMDRATLEAYRDLWVAEPTPNRGTFASLTESEMEALVALRELGDVRLEQERIPWGLAWGRILDRALDILGLTTAQ